MKSAYEKIVDVISGLTPIHIHEDSDCDEGVYLHMVQEEKIKYIISILKDYRYLDTGPKFLS